MPAPSSACPSCGRPASGNFCSNCGTTLGKLSCPKCGAAVRSAARYCASCGTPVPRAVGSAGNRTPWIAAGVAVVALLGLLVFMVARSQPKVAAATTTTDAPVASGSGGTPPDLSTMTPRERFDRLYNRIMSAAESGDEATVTRFTPMAIQAYGMLDTVDADARYHLALLQVHTGGSDVVLAIADTILKENPGHLFGYMIRGAVARFQKNDAALKQVYSDFLAHYDAEMAAKRPEYTDHSRAVADFKSAAEGSK